MTTYLNTLKRDLKNEIARDAAYIKAWQSVTMASKKDGSHFQNLGKNFQNATINVKRFAWRGYEKEISVYTYTKETGYISDTLNIYCEVKYAPEWVKDAAKEKPTNVVDDVYVYDADDIYTAIHYEIERLFSQVEQEKAELNNIDAIYNKYEIIYKNMIKDLKNECAEINAEKYFYNTIISSIHDINKY